MSRSVACTLLAFALLSGCSREPEPATSSLAPLPVVVGAPAVRAHVARSTEHARCEARIRKVQAAPALPGAPGFQSRRHELLARGKAEPVLFRREPKVGEQGLEARSLAKQIADSPSPGYTLARSYSRLANRPELVSELLLREGYLYAESPSLSAAVVEHVELHHLFRGEPVIIERGAERLRAVKTPAPKHYVYADGPERGAKARVLLFDRLWAEGRDLGPPLHIELRSAQVRAGFEQMKNLHLTESGLVAELRYGTRWVKSLFRLEGNRAALECELVPEAAKSEVAWVRALSARRQRVLDAKRAAIVAQIEEALPFDEPITEDGQQDGNLRPAWIWAYNHGWDSYEFNDDHYRVFDGAGRPKVPQVCIDFITDTLERASGTWWGRQPEQRQRQLGRLNFDELAIDNRRSVDRFVRFAKDHPEWFDVYDLAPEERVRFIERDRFFGYLLEHRDKYLPGDIVTIHGPRDDGEMHYHSFWIYDSDPVTGMPTFVASNAGRPRIRTWEFEMRVAPQRSIKHRIRPRLQWLETVLVTGERTLERPALLASAPI